MLHVRLSFLKKHWEVVAFGLGLKLLLEVPAAQIGTLSPSPSSNFLLMCILGQWMMT